MTVAGQNPIAFVSLCHLLNAKELTKEQLSEAVGVTPGTIIKWMRLLSSKGLIYESRWDRTKTGWVARWKWGYPGYLYAVPKPKPLTAAEYCKNYRKRNAAQIEEVWNVAS